MLLEREGQLSAALGRVCREAERAQGLVEMRRTQGLRHRRSPAGHGSAKAHDAIPGQYEARVRSPTSRARRTGLGGGRAGPRADQRGRERDCRRDRDEDCSMGRRGPAQRSTFETSAPWKWPWTSAAQIEP